MTMRMQMLQSCAIVVLLTGCATDKQSTTGHTVQTAQTADTTTQAKLYDGLDTYHRDISTDDELAQRYFNQGFALLFGFNHDEAIRSFRQVAELDPDHPMPWWGIAYAHGMHLNNPEMTEAQWKAATEAAREAQRRKHNGNALERALVDAIAQRYTWPAPDDQFEYDSRYADAMQQVYQRFPNDHDVATLYAESLMNLQPWDYWTEDSQPKGRIEEVIDVLKRVIAREPDHPGANHLYIHAVEASDNPDRALASAERLRNRIPGSGHLVHMPSHIYVRVGDYQKAADCNVQAVKADRRYFNQAPKPDFYNLYYGHNQHFLAYAAMMEGRYEQAMQAARDLEREIPDDALAKYGFVIEGIMPTTYHVMIRFGRWEDVLRESKPPAGRPVSLAVHHYARGIAHSALGQTEQAREEIEHFEQAAAAIPDEWWIMNNHMSDILPIARNMLAGELAFREGRHEEAFSHLRQAVAAEDRLIYDEPPGWMLPVRHALGALLMSAGRYAEAEEVYREDLKRNRNNGWSLLGLQQSLVAQGRTDDANEIQPQLAAAWSRADVKPTSSCFCEPNRHWASHPQTH